MRKTKEKGITLIALIITIIVMLILVVVTINMAVNGDLFSKAKTGAEGTQREADKELLISAVLDSIGNDGRVNQATLGNLASGLGFTYKSATGEYVKEDTKNKFSVSADGLTVAWTGIDTNPWLARGLTSPNVVFDRPYVCDGDAFNVEEFTLYSDGSLDCGNSFSAQQINEGFGSVFFAGEDYFYAIINDECLLYVITGSNTARFYEADELTGEITKQSIIANDIAASSSDTAESYTYTVSSGT